MLDTSCIKNKELVYVSYTPLPFAIYAGLLEDTYMLNNAVAMSSLFSPGIARVLGRIIQDVSTTPLILDDLFGMLAGVPAEHSVLYKDWINTLSSLRRITWSCPHREATPGLANYDMIALVPPCAFFAKYRKDIISDSTLNTFPEKWFLLPAGDAQSRQSIQEYWAEVCVDRDVFGINIPAVHVDSHWVLIAPEGKLLRTVPFPQYVTPVYPRKTRAFKQERILQMYEKTIS